MNGPDIHREVLDNLEDGVLVVGLGGRIETLNPAAERILGLEAGETAGRGFAELFILREGFDEFTQLVIDATTGGTGAQRRVVEVRGGDEARSLSVATSYLRRGDGGEAVAAIAVFSDITELRELRDTELRLAQEAEAQHRRLQDAYREIEERNTALAAALRKVRVVQGLGMVLAVGLFLGAGFWTTRSLDLFGSAPAEASAGAPGAERRITVEPQRIEDGLTLRGTLSPWRTVAMRSPVDGDIVAMNYRAGRAVSQGDVLLEVDLTRVTKDYAKARKQHAKALKRLREQEDWESSADMIKARRSFAKTRLDMEGHRTTINKSRFLFKEGLIAALAHEDAERQFRGQELEFITAEEELAAARAKGSGDALKDAQLELKTASAKLRAAEAALAHGALRAPITGVVLAAAPRGGQRVEVGGAVRAGQELLIIGDFSRMMASVKVDETDVVRLQAGQKVKVTGNAFPDLTLGGEVTHVASQADPQSRGIPKFGAAVTLDPVKPELAGRLKAGMSVQLRIVTYDNPDALSAPLSAVDSRGGVHRLRVVDPDTGAVEEREVEIGWTARDSVEIRAGLKAGETILVPGG